jgi:hypothetical protein
MSDEHEHDIDIELDRQSREEAADDAMFNKVLLLAANIGPQSAAPSSPARVEAQARDARRLLGTPPDAPATSSKIEVIVGRFEFEYTSFEQWVSKAWSWFGNARLRGDQVLCVDAAGRVCLTGREFMRARDEGTFPIKVYRATL